MREAGGGSIVNISSNAGMEGVQGVIGYVASKGDPRDDQVRGPRLGRHGIRVNVVCRAASRRP